MDREVIKRVRLLGKSDEKRIGNIFGGLIKVSEDPVKSEVGECVEEVTEKEKGVEIKKKKSRRIIKEFSKLMDNIVLTIKSNFHTPIIADVICEDVKRDLEETMFNIQVVIFDEEGEDE